MQQKILIVGNDPDFLFLVDRHLKNVGYETDVLNKGLKIINSEIAVPDLFLLDHELETINGLAICKFLKLRKETKHVPVILLSLNHALRNKALHAGASDFLRKPFGLQALNEIVRKNMPVLAFN